jgi:hypothetical protein
MALPLLGLAGALGIGLSLGLLGSGGSILTVPVLAYLFGQDEKQAIAGSLLVVALVALTGAIAQVRRQRVDWTAVGWFGLPGVASASLGQALARRIERDLAGANSWQVTVNDDGALRWTSDAGERDTQPARNFWQRMQNLLFKLAPASYY